MLRRWLTNNLHLKLISLTLTFVLYLLVAGDRTRQRTWQVDLEVIDIPSGWVLLDAPEPVTVTVQGSARAFSRLGAEGVRVWPIGPLSPGQRIWSLRPEDLSLPTGLSVVSISPPEVPLQLETRVAQTVQIQVALRGSVPSGYELLSTRVNPERLSVTAPASYFPDLRAIDTETLDISGLVRTTTRRVALTPQRPFIHWDLETPVEVVLEVGVVEETRVYEEIALQAVGAGQERCEVVDATMAVTVRGPRAILEQMDPATVFATVDCTAPVVSGPGLYTLTPRLNNLPAALAITEQSLTTARVRVLPPPEPPIEPTTAPDGPADSPQEAGDGPP